MEAPRNSESVNSSNEENIEICDLQSVLRESLNDEQLFVIDYTASNLIPYGENLGGMIVKLDVTIHRKNCTEKEHLHLVAKTIGEIQNHAIIWPQALQKEVFFYLELIPMYEKLEKEMDISDNDVLDCLPKYMGHRYSLSGEVDEVDEHSLLLMENLKHRGYYLLDRRKGLDLEHSKFALLSMAKFHALGIALKIKHPEDFEKVKSKASVVGINFDIANEGYDIILKIIQENAYFSKYLPKIEASFSRIKTRESYTDMAEPWVTIVHGDFWVNNLMFHKNTNGKIDNVKFLDFQTFYYTSPQKDLAFYFNCSLEEYCYDYLDELIDLYYSSFTAALQRMGCDVNSFTKSSFYKELGKQMLTEFPRSALCLRFHYHEETEEEKRNKELLGSFMFSEPSEAYKNKLKKIVDTYNKKGWL